jgi:multidrug efflux pump subunit AcrA (membrane-fusion protein)
MFELAEKKLKRHEDLFEKRMISRSLLDDVVQQSNATTIEYQLHRRALANIPSQMLEQEARIARAEAALSQAHLDLEHAVITAPFSGPVLTVQASPGNHSVLGAALVELADINGFEVRAPVPNEYSARVRQHLTEGREITATARTGDGELTLVLTRLAGSVHSGQSGLNAFFKLPADSGQQFPALGRVVDLAVTLPPEGDVIALPVQSIYESDRIYEVSDTNRLQSITVDRVGGYQTQTGEYRVLVRGASLTAGKRIITTQLPKAISGLLVAPVS